MDIRKYPRIEAKMIKRKEADVFIVQNIGKPVNRVIKEHEWLDSSTHKTLAEAILQIKKNCSHLSPMAWDDHYRIVEVIRRKLRVVTENEIFNCRIDNLKP